MKKITLFVLVILAAACSTTRDRDRLTDPEIAMVMRVANLGEVREGNVARQKATDPAVRLSRLIELASIHEQTKSQQRGDVNGSRVACSCDETSHERATARASPR